MKRIILLVTVVLLMAAMLVMSVVPALAVTREPDDGPLFPTGRAGPAWGVPVEPTTACNTLAGIAGFEWRAGGEVCWLQLPVRLPASSL
jgi:hypothetical protein